MEFVKTLLEEQKELLTEELRFAEDLEYAETKQRLSEVTDALNKLFICGVSGSLPLTFEECLREEFLLNTQNYPKEYHNLFNKKFNRARKRFVEQ